MTSCHLTKRWGETINDPQHNDLVAALNELVKKDPEHPDCSISTEDGWSLSVFEEGLVVFENIETGEGPWHMRDVPQSVVLDLWQLLQSNELLVLKQRQWLAGYGSNT